MDSDENKTSAVAQRPPLVILARPSLIAVVKHREAIAKGTSTLDKEVKARHWPRVVSQLHGRSLSLPEGPVCITGFERVCAQRGGSAN